MPDAVLLMPLRTEKCILVVQQPWQKAIYGQVIKCLIVHECNFHIQAKSGLQLMCGDGQFSQRWSHM